MSRNQRSLLVSILALWHGRSQKQISAASGIPQKRVSQILRGEAIDDEVLERLLAAVGARPAEVAVVKACLESLAFLEQDQELTAEERAEVEGSVLELAGINRRVLTETARRSRTALVLDRYPEPGDREPARWHASMLLGLLRSLPQDQQWALVSVGEEYRSWALVEKLCEESVVQASRDLGRAASLARLARKAARRVRGPQEWVRRVRAFAAAHAANVLRVSGRLKAADSLLQRTKLLWETGSDPAYVLDPGRLLDLEASLRRAQRRFEEALNLLDKARKVSRFPGRILIKKGFTLEVMGDYEQAIEALLEAESMPDVRVDPRLLNILQNNLALNLCHVGRFSEAAAMAQKVREAAADMGDLILLLRVTWIDGLIAAGLGRTEEALSRLAQARREFAARGMGYDVALVLLEEAALLLDEGRTAEVKELTRRLPAVFAAEEVHREALTALRLFHEAAQREEATAELARRILRYLFRARHDRGLPFER